MDNGQEHRHPGAGIGARDHLVLAPVWHVHYPEFMHRASTLPLVVFLSVSIVPACGTGDDVGDDDDDVIGADASPVGGDLPVPEHGFQLTTPDIVLAAGEEATWCYYTTIPTDSEVGVSRWESVMTPGSHHMIMYFTGTATRPDGTLEQDCNIGGGGGLDLPVWAYASQSIENTQAMPPGVGMQVGQQQAAIIQMHYLNVTDGELRAHVTINGHTYPDGTEYERAAPYITFNTQISVPPEATGSVTGTCAVPAGKKFFLMSTHAHRFSTRAYVTDGSEMILETLDWEDPETREWNASPYYEFSNSLTYTCEYFNFSDQTVTTGDSAETDEMCMAVGYFFPATDPVFCVNSFVVP